MRSRPAGVQSVMLLESLPFVPLVDPRELRLDLSERLARAEKWADVSPASLADQLPRPALDLLWAREPALEHDDLAAAVRALHPAAAGVLLVAESALREVVAELPAADPLGQRLRWLVSGKLLTVDDWLVFAFEDRRCPFVGWLGERDEVLQLFTRLKLLAGQSVPVLVLGETGTGKELIARALHRLGPRAGRAWMAINCAELPESLLESELFGHARGAFTGATTDRAGLFESAGAGTVFLDEIGELPLTAQAKLLRLLEEHRVRRLGAVEARPLACRIVAATNRDLGLEIERGRFRADLLFRLRGSEVRLRPLRERRPDVLPLAEFFLAHAALRFRRPARELGDDARLVLLAHAWRGNARELRQAIEAAVLVAEGTRVSAAHLSLVPGGAPIDSAAPLLTAQAAERAHILRALISTAGNRGAAARLLGLTRQSLQRRLVRHGIGHAAGNEPPETADLAGSGLVAAAPLRPARDGGGTPGPSS